MSILKLQNIVVSQSGSQVGCNLGKLAEKKGLGRMEFHWELRGGDWMLLPSSISVRETDGWWMIYVGDRPMAGRYTSDQGARLDAWQFAYSKRRALFGSYRIRLNGHRAAVAERIANLAGIDLDGAILPPSTEGGIDRTPKPWWKTWLS